MGFFKELRQLEALADGSAGFQIGDFVKVTHGNFSDTHGFIRDAYLYKDQVHYEVELFAGGGKFFSDGSNLRPLNGLDVVFKLV